MSYKALILDFGGVLLNIDYDAPIKAFAALGIANFGSHFQQASQSDFMDRFEKGECTNEEFRNHLRTYSKKELTDQQIDEAWNCILKDLPEDRMKLLEQLSKKYALFLLSNTNRIHIKSFENSMAKHYGENYFQNLFDRIYFSSSIGMRKPDLEIFEFVLKENNLNPEQVCFIDDSIQHVLAAKITGINSFHLDLKSDSLVELLKRNEII